MNDGRHAQRREQTAAALLYKPISYGCNFPPGLLFFFFLLLREVIRR